ncbi:MAG: phage tail terminator-like protein, partial [Vicinamibacterales bacterium]
QGQGDKMATGLNARIAAALHTRLNTLVLTPVHQIAWENKPYTRVIGTPFLAPAFLPNRTDFGAVGTNAPRRHRGLYQVLVYGAENVGEVPGIEIGDRIVEHFTPGSVIAEESVRVRIGSFDGSVGVGYLSNAFNEDGWRITPVTIPWWCDTF